MHKRWKKYAVLGVMISLLTASVRADEGVEVITIESYEQLYDFAKACELDSYSIDKEVVLTRSIVIPEGDFEGIPVFNGTFDGKGYTISGLNLDEANDYQGFFRYLGEDAKVKDLHIQGTIDSIGSVMGGIAGQNLGLIENCTFDGTIEAQSVVGGIVGKNKGTVMNVLTKGTLLGESQVGGSVGENSGTLIQCTNEAAIGTTLTAFDTTITESDIGTTQAMEKVAEVMDIGGIAGINTGVLQHAVNTGVVGYPHVGYNIGGIVGRQSGYIAEATNEGKVYGRKEVGGIVGQLEPHISISYSVSKLQTLQNQINTLSGMTSQLTQDTKTTHILLNEQLITLNDTVADAADATETLLEETKDLLDQNIDEVNRISITFAEVLDDCVPISEDLETTIEAMSDALYEIERAVKDLEDVAEGIEDVGDVGGDVLDALEDAGQSLRYTIQALGDISYAFETAMIHLQEGAPIETVLEALRGIPRSISLALDGLVEAQYGFSQAVQESRQLPDAMDTIKDAFEESGEHVEDAFSALEDMTEALEDAAEGITDLVTMLSEEDPIYFVTTHGAYEEARDALSVVTTQLTDDVAAVYDLAGEQITLVIDDFEAINQQVNRVFNTLIEMVEDVLSGETAELFEIEDLSYQDIETMTSGKVTGCVNTGRIEGDINIGGIAGSIAFEYDFDKEDDYKLDSKNQEVKRKSGVAVIAHATNTGKVIGKKEAVGGIIGFMDFGYITQCQSFATVMSEEGNYVGGIAGRSHARINACYAKNSVSGKQYVGGIVGEGYVVQNNYAIGTIEATKGKQGAIAGGLYQGDNVSVVGNYFVNDTVGGIDSISYDGAATPTTYKELLAKEGIPDSFREMRIRFVVDEAVVSEHIIAYGRTLNFKNVPKVPEKEGCYGYWDVPAGVPITTDLEIEAIYKPYITTLSSELFREDLPVILVDGTFVEGDTVEVTEGEDEGTVYTLCLNQSDRLITRIRYLMPEGSHEIMIQTNDGWENAQAIYDGKYAVVEVAPSTRPIHLKIKEVATVSIGWWLLGGGMLVVGCALVGAYLYNKRKRHKVKERTHREDYSENMDI